MRPPMSFLAGLHERARQARKHIVLPEGTEARTVQAGARAAEAGIARITLLGPREDVDTVARQVKADLSRVEVAPPPGTREQEAALRAYVERVRHRGIGEDEARRHLEEPLLQGALGVATGRFDGM